MKNLVSIHVRVPVALAEALAEMKAAYGARSREDLVRIILREARHRYRDASRQARLRQRRGAG